MRVVIPEAPGVPWLEIVAVDRQLSAGLAEKLCGELADEREPFGRVTRCHKESDAGSVQADRDRVEDQRTWRCADGPRVVDALEEVEVDWRRQWAVAEPVGPAGPRREREKNRHPEGAE